MNYTPLNYNQINVAAGTYNPSPVKAYNNQSFCYWQRSLYHRVCSVFKLDVDDIWQGNVKDFLNYCLIRYGYVAVFEHDKFGLSFQPCTLYGYNFYYQPTEALVANPLLNERFEIGKTCEILKLTPDYYGIWDIIDYYAEKLSSLDSAINMSIVNNKMAYVMGAKNKGSAEALKKIMDKINKGEPTVIYDMRILDDTQSKGTPFQFLERANLKQSYITTDQLQDFQTLLSNFDAEIGIPTTPYQKKERMVTSEAESREIDATSRSSSWVDCLNECFNIINEHYGTNMSASPRYSPEEVDEDIDEDVDEDVDEDTSEGGESDE